MKGKHWAPLICLENKNIIIFLHPYSLQNWIDFIRQTITGIEPSEIFVNGWWFPLRNPILNYFPSRNCLKENYFIFGYQIRNHIFLKKRQIILGLELDFCDTESLKIVIFIINSVLMSQFNDEDFIEMIYCISIQYKRKK